MRFTYYVKGFECESCARVISRIVSRFPGANFIEADAKSGKIVFECDENDVGLVVKEVGERGFSLHDQPVAGTTAGYASGPEHSLGKAAWLYLNGIFSGGKDFSAERKLMENSLLSFILVIGLGVVVALFLPAKTASAFGDAKILLALLAVGVGANSFAFWHSFTYRRDFTCMGGMMVGMTLGMISGFMAGALVGATNGMFVGSVAGMALGMIVGGYAGKCCGVMGFLEGLMAGLMGGIMGAMTSLMLFNDHLVEFLFLLFAACGMILVALSYMIYKEAGGSPARMPSGFKMLLGNLAVALVIVLVMLFGPRGPIVWAGFG
ncbi:TPA: hypothetical protein HA244_01375 [Candidatus Micrarchaeota archaeon]|nr:hypothetical protein [Candidatus Micrarchaeota archaeon]